METFPCLYFTYETRYPESGTRMTLGNSYQFDTPPTAPDQRQFLLTLPGMQYFLDGGDQIDLTQQVGRNMAVLEKFYNDHKRALPFEFSHPLYGTVVCKFLSPLIVPKGVPGGQGMLQEVSVSLIEIP